MKYSSGVIMIIVILFHGVARAADKIQKAEDGLLNGLYEVDVKLRLPFLDDKTGHQTVNICISNTAVQLVDSLSVLSKNTPFDRCFKQDIVQTQNAISFRYQCQGRGAATAIATFEFSGTRFRGEIAMKMGGKNMTMTEIQTAHRLGDC